ncbi:MAG TPA: peptidoglycan glycosyltransferase, partial [Marinilabiliaceae bacterium]|nr:peptidoglycan glycosyltransferase [Marinilabiliaceae bacterium]
GVEYQASFVGYFPAERPRYSCIVVVTSPSNNVYYGNIVAGSVFREIADRVYATGFDFVVESEWDESSENSVYPYSKGGRVSDLATIFEELDYPVYERHPVSDWISTMASDSGVVFRPKPVPGGLVPAVIGMGAKDALSILENLGLQVHLQGVGRVVHQSQQAGSRVRPGSTIFIRLE